MQNYKLFGGLLVVVGVLVFFVFPPGSSVLNSVAAISVSGTSAKFVKPDLKIKNAEKDTTNYDYLFTLKVCVNGPRSINDLKKTNKKLTDFPFSYTVFDKNSGDKSTYMGNAGAAEDLKDGKCEIIGMVIQPADQAIYDRSGKIRFNLDPYNLIEESNEHNNTFTYSEPVSTSTPVATCLGGPSCPISTPVQGPQIKVSLAPDTPLNSQYPVGTKDVIFLKVRFTALTDDIKISSIAPLLVKDSAGTGLDIKTLKLYDGNALIGEAQFSGPLGGSNKVVYTATTDFIVPKYSSRNIIVKGDIPLDALVGSYFQAEVLGGTFLGSLSVDRPAASVDEVGSALGNSIYIISSYTSSTPIPPTPTPMVCNYPRFTPEGCRYVPGPDYDPATGCGMILSCPTDKSVVKVIYPNGGEIFRYGDIYNFAFTVSKDLDGQMFDVYLESNKAGVSKLLIKLKAVGGIQNEIGGQLAYPPADDYTLLVFGRISPSGMTVFDVSDAPFTILPAADPVSLQVIHPNGGEKLQVDKKFNLRWKTKNLPRKTDIKLMARLVQADGQETKIQWSLDNDGSESVTIPPNIDSGLYRLRMALDCFRNEASGVEGYASCAAYDDSDQLFVVYDPKYTKSIHTKTIYDVNGGLGIGGNDISYSWSYLPEGVLPGDLMLITFNYNNYHMASSCVFSEYLSGTGAKGYYCQATWSINLSALPDRQGYKLKNYTFTAYNLVKPPSLPEPPIGLPSGFDSNSNKGFFAAVLDALISPLGLLPKVR